MKTFIIAEAGVNHNGSLQFAKKLIDVACDADVDAVKFQTFKAEKLVIAKSPMAKYQIKNIGADDSQFAMLKKLELSEADHKELAAYCQKNNIKFMSTPFDEGSVDFLGNLGMDIYKIPSGEITNKALIQYIARQKKTIFLSTGMSFLGEVEKAIGWISEVWYCLSKKPDLVILHCVSNYPASEEEINLLSIKTLRDAFGLPVGYSDHSKGIEIPIAAVALGARIIEKHFTLDKDMEGPDHKASLDPKELKALVKGIRKVEKALGDGVKRPTESEMEIKKIGRRSLVASRKILAGEIITQDDITIKRPGTGIQPELKEVIIGFRAVRDIDCDSLLDWKDFKNA
jgi:N-acetylneuraminate synthase